MPIRPINGYAAWFWIPARRSAEWSNDSTQCDRIPGQYWMPINKQVCGSGGVPVNAFVQFRANYPLRNPQVVLRLQPHPGLR